MAIRLARCLSPIRHSLYHRRLTQRVCGRQCDIVVGYAKYSHTRSSSDISSQYLRTDNQTWVPRSIGNPATKLQAALKRQRRAEADPEDPDVAMDDAEQSVEEDGDGEAEAEGSKVRHSSVVI